MHAIGSRYQSVGLRGLRRQRGSALVVCMIALTGLVVLSGITLLSVQGGITASGHDRHKAIALYAAESGAAAAMIALRSAFNSETGWTDYVTANPAPLTIAGNGALPGTSANILSQDMNAWYEIEIVNNPDDAGNDLVGGLIEDRDNRVIIRSTGHGPSGITAQVEWQVASYTATGSRPCPGYGQKGMSEDGSGRNDCLGTINFADVVTWPGAL